MTLRTRIALLSAIVACTGVTHADTPVEKKTKAFPTAEGFGMYAKGGRGGQVLFVENLNDSGPGSLRAAVETKGPRTVLFRVSGTIELQKQLMIREPFLTIAGQTAPGDGICLTNYELYVRTNDVIIRHLRIRPGNSRPGERDAVTLRSATNTIVDHVSASWSIDEVFSTTYGQDVTVQWCMITEALHQGHHKGNHGFGGLISGQRITYHHNFYAHNRSRNPRPASGFFDFRNNVIYNWNDEAGYAGTINKQQLNYINNYLKPGPATEKNRELAYHSGGPETFIYFAGNVLEGAVAEGQNDRALLNLRNSGNVVERPFKVIAPRTETAAEAMRKVVADVGATLPKRDAMDTRIINDFHNGTGSLIDDPKEVGGLPVLQSAPAPADADNDGMPDDWELKHKLDPKNADDRNADPDSDGYTHLEEFLNNTSPAIPD